MDCKTKIGDYIGQRMGTLGIGAATLAAKAGFDSTMCLIRILRGQSRLPLSKLASVAKALRTDRKLLLKYWPTDTDPEAANDMEDVLEHCASDSEWALVKKIRELGGVPFMEPMSLPQREAFSKFLGTLEGSLSAPATVH